MTALAGLALLAAGDERVAPNPDSKGQPTAVDLIYRYLRGEAALRGAAGARSTYDAGVMLVFVTAYWRGRAEPKPTGRTRPGRRSKRNPCNLPPDVMKWVQDVATWLVSVAKKPTFTWGYPMHRDDHSNSLYAFLGLRAARDCGAGIPPTVFLMAAKTMMDRQEQEGPKVMRFLPGPDPDSSPCALDAGDRARGWSYLPQPLLATGSMTTAGIAILAITHDALTRPKRYSAYTSQLEAKLTRSVQDSFSWLDKHWTIESNPGPGAPPWHYYYLCGLERAAVVAGRDLIGQHDWYIEGARLLVTRQEEDGRWTTGEIENEDYQPNDVVDTAWAILFLAKATQPMPPVELPAILPASHAERIAVARALAGSGRVGEAMKVLQGQGDPEAEALFEELRSSPAGQREMEAAEKYSEVVTWLSGKLEKLDRSKYLRRDALKRLRSVSDRFPGTQAAKRAEARITELGLEEHK